MLFIVTPLIDDKNSHSQVDKFFKVFFTWSLIAIWK